MDAITTFCLFEEEDVLRFCFFILDREKNGYIEKDEMRMLVNMLYNIDPVKGPTGNTKVAFEKLSVQQDGKIEFWEFELFNKAFPSLFFPAFRLQVGVYVAVWRSQLMRSCGYPLCSRVHPLIIYDSEKSPPRTLHKPVKHIPHIFGHAWSTICCMISVLDVSSSRPISKVHHEQKHNSRTTNEKVKMMQAVWGEKWWGRKKRKLQDNLEERRRNEEADRLADSNRLENMRQRRIKRKMGACKYYCWPCGRAEYDKMFPRANIVVADPEAEEAERQRKVVRVPQERVRDNSG